MLKKINSSGDYGQAVMEYVFIIGIITVALFAMTQAMKRGTQSLIKTAADEIGVQVNSDQSNIQGFLEYSNTDSNAVSNRQVIDRSRQVTYIRQESETVGTESLTNLGFTNEE